MGQGPKGQGEFKYPEGLRGPLRLRAEGWERQEAEGSEGSRVAVETEGAGEGEWGSAVGTGMGWSS